MMKRQALSSLVGTRDEKEITKQASSLCLFLISYFFLAPNEHKIPSLEDISFCEKTSNAMSSFPHSLFFKHFSYSCGASSHSFYEADRP